MIRTSLVGGAAHRSSRRTTVSSCVLLGIAALAVPTTLSPASAASPTVASTVQQRQTLVVHAGETVTLDTTTRLRLLTIESGGSLVASSGHSLTLTVNGVETGGVIEETGGALTVLEPGTYRGDVVLTVTDTNPVPWQSFVFPFRQGLYVDADGVDESRSVPSAVVGGYVTDRLAKNVKITSTGENFNGVYASGGTYELVNPKIDLTGNGRSDFVGYGAAVTADDGARVVVDGAKISNKGVMRTGVVADGGSNVIVKNSRIHTADGTLPAGYQSTVDLAYMQQAPWMLGIVGTVRTTNLLGTDTKATYISSDLSSDGWGVLSTDTGQDGQLTSINSTVTTTGGEGYGSYAIGNATERFLGTTFDVDTYAAINRGGSIHYGDSTRAAVAELNETLDLGLTAKELRSLPVRSTTVDSERWGVMWHGSGSVKVDGGTVIRSKRATFLDKGQAVDVEVDGSDGARLLPRDGVLFQVMEDDDPGPQMVNGVLLNTGVYTEPTGTPSKVDTFDVTQAHDADAVATFEDIDLSGDFYNAIRGNNPAGPFGPGLAGKNLVLTFDGGDVTGVISASRSQHRISTIRAEDYEEIGVVTNTPSPVVNNGVIVTLDAGSTWTVTGTSYLSKLTVDASAAVKGRAGAVTMTVDGVTTPIVPGHTYSGAIKLTVG